MHRLTMTFALALSALAAGPAAAFVPLNNNHTHMAIGADFAVNTNDFPVGGTFHEEIMAKTDEWDAGSGLRIRGATYHLDHAHYTGLTVIANLRNEIHRGSLPDGVLGRATRWGVGDHWEECDININDDPTDDDGGDLDWSVIAPSPTGKAPLPLVVLHEYGHCIGLAHDDGEGDLMTTMQTGGPWVGESFHAIAPEDERTFLRDIHGDASTGQNLAVTTYTCCNDDGDATNFAFDASWGDDPDEVVVDFAFGYLNLGTDTQEVRVTFRLLPESAPTWPAGWDPNVFDPLVVDETTMTLGPNNPYTPTKRVEFVVPDTQRWFIGAFIDSDGDVAETNEGNNKLVSRCSVRISGAGFLHTECE